MLPENTVTVNICIILVIYVICLYLRKTLQAFPILLQRYGFSKVLFAFGMNSAFLQHLIFFKITFNTNAELDT